MNVTHHAHYHAMLLILVRYSPCTHTHTHTVSLLLLYVSIVNSCNVLCAVNTNWSIFETSGYTYDNTTKRNMSAAFVAYQLAMIHDKHPLATYKVILHVHVSHCLSCKMNVCVYNSVVISTYMVVMQ
jgi:hypothetical protein